MSSRFGLLALIVVAVLAIGCERRASQGLKLGAIVPLTGDAAPYGTALKKGMDLAIEEVNAKGGVGGKNVQIVFEDDRNLAQDGVTAFNKLKSVDRVPLVMGAMFSAVTLAIAPIAEKDKVVLLSPTSSDVSLTSAGDYIFRIYPSDAYDGVFLATFAADQLQARKAAILSMQASSTIAVSQLFRTAFEGKGGAVVSEESFKEGTTDFRAVLTKLKDGQQDLVFLPSALREAALLLRQAKELGIKARFLGISTLFDPKLLELAGDAAESVMFSSPVFDPTSEAPQVRAFVSAYKTKYKSDPDILGAYGYDVVNVAVAAAGGAGNESMTADTFKAGLNKIRDFRGATGTMSFDGNGDVTKELRMMAVSAGKFVPFKAN